MTDWSEGKFTRRRMVAGAVAGCGGLVGVGGLSGCGRLITGAKTTRSMANPVILTWRPGLPGIGQNAVTTATSLMYQATAPFRAENKGVDIHFSFAGGWDGSDMGSWSAAFTGGDAPDVSEIWADPWVFPASGFLLDLAPYVSKDSLNMTVWPTGAIEYVHSLSALGPNPGGLYYLPAYLNTLAIALNKTAVNGLGLEFPSPNWTYAEWTTLAEALTTRGNTAGSTPQRGGMLLSWTAIPPSFLLHAFGGSYVDPRNNARSGLTNPGTISFFDWVVPLMNAGVMVQGNPWIQGIGTGYVGSEMAQSAFMVEAVQQFSDIDWDFYPVPVGPAGQFSAGFIDVIGVSVTTKQPELAYEFAKWLTWDPGFATSMMRISLRSPMRNDQWDQWGQFVRSAAPPLATKNLAAFIDVGTGERGGVWSDSVFRYQNTSALGILTNWWSQMIYRGTDVTTALQQADAQINALESISASASASKTST